MTKWGWRARPADADVPDKNERKKKDKGKGKASKRSSLRDESVRAMEKRNRRMDRLLEKSRQKRMGLTSQQTYESTKQLLGRGSAHGSSARTGAPGISDKTNRSEAVTAAERRRMERLAEGSGESDSKWESQILYRRADNLAQRRRDPMSFRKASDVAQGMTQGPTVVSNLQDIDDLSVERRIW